MTRTSSAGALTAVAISLCLVLTACAGSPAGGEVEASQAPAASAPAADPVPSAQPVDPLDSVTTLVARPETLELRDAAGAVVASLDYRSDVDAAVASLTTVFSAAPADEEIPGSGSESPRTVHRWDGFELVAPHYDGVSLDATLSLLTPAFRVHFTSRASGEHALTTAEGHAVGDLWTEFVASPGVDANGLCPEMHGESVVAPVSYSDGLVRDRAFSVAFHPSDGGAVIAGIDAPAYVHPDGCA